MSQQNNNTRKVTKTAAEKSEQPEYQQNNMMHGPNGHMPPPMMPSPYGYGYPYYPPPQMMQHPHQMPGHPGQHFQPPVQTTSSSEVQELNSKLDSVVSVLSQIKADTDRMRLEAEMAKAEAEKIKAESEKAKFEAEKLKAEVEAEKSRAEIERIKAQTAIEQIKAIDAERTHTSESKPIKTKSKTEVKETKESKTESNDLANLPEPTSLKSSKETKDKVKPKTEVKESKTEVKDTKDKTKTETKESKPSSKSDYTKSWAQVVNPDVKHPSSASKDKKQTSDDKISIVDKVKKGSQEFYEHLKGIIDDEIEWMEDNNRSDVEYYRKISSKVTEFGKSWSLWMYGAPRKDKDFTVRNRKVYTDNNISMAFYRAQLYAANKGYKLLDCSDPSKSGDDKKIPNLFIVLATKHTIMSQESSKIWHGFNKLSKKAMKAIEDKVMDDSKSEDDADKESKADNAEDDESDDQSQYTNGSDDEKEDNEDN